ncbi:MAG TPA: aminodeoxychorismate synthase component I [Burkholderiaceae bacterium]|nr:aminodeoxychorismate synthase component I [Burkholderiaceae bacterium]
MSPFFALLDDAGATPAQPASRLYEGFVREHVCRDPLQLDAAWAAVDADLKRGHHAVLLADYEWGARLLRAGHEALGSDDASALRVLVFERLQKLSREQVDAWLARLDGSDAPTPAGVTALRADVDRPGFDRAIAAIHAAIRAGETYQVNYTYRCSFDAFGSPVALYRRLRARQPVAYGALMHLPTPTPRWVLSCSPELFVRHQQGLLTARPMKGTARREREPEGDSETARLLSLDEKNRAENLMIVDLLRNDLGRIARTGSVRVPDLFTIEPYATVFQMTSTVQAQVEPGLGLPEMLRALFPCGSITGAPKHHTMQIIAGLEQGPRGLYTGAIGWLDAPREPGRACGDFCFSVAIRTLTLQDAQADGLQPGRLGIGAGIVLDSVAADEFAECRLKARFVSGLDPGFSLFETLRVDARDAGRPCVVPHLALHLARLARSAQALGFVFDELAIQRALAHGLASLSGGGPWRLRLDLHKSGQAAIRSAPLAPLPDGPVGLLLAEGPPPQVPQALLGHKTSWRPGYDAAVQAAEARGAFDILFFNANGHLTEGARSNVFGRLAGGRWATPPLAAGVLPGVMRGVLLQDPASPVFAAEERPVSRAELLEARELIVCNALRGALPARLAGPPPSR